MNMKGRYVQGGFIHHGDRGWPIQMATKRHTVWYHICLWLPIVLVIGYFILAILTKGG